MQRLLKTPITYLVLAETAVVAALGVAGWQLAQRLRGPAAPAAQLIQPGQLPPAGQDPGEAQLPVLPTARPKPSPRPSAGSGTATAPAATDPSYWSGKLDRLNSDQAQLQALQWQVIQAVKGAAERYLRDVVFSAVERAQRDHPLTLPTPTPRGPP